MNDEESLSTDQAAHALGIGTSRLRDLILAGRLPARKVGHTWVIFCSDLQHVADRRPGRPRSRSANHLATRVDVISAHGGPGSEG